MTNEHEQPDLDDVLEQARHLAQGLIAAQQAPGDASFTGVAGGGLVKATVSPTGHLQHLEISPVAADPDKTEALADSVLAAVREAHGAAAAALQARFAGLTQNL
ncbi:YbaB/EbfC family nucleoid-associated protein [Streptomyces sp. 2A115]|uniref:YbaB/EbfC family nucleoid-associated protein n=1 Tax=Streptomyces sp. 2A115 TaxID=3457439 RepID=UPI003FCF1447